MSMNNLLFGIIGVLMVAIVAVGGFAAYRSLTVDQVPTYTSTSATTIVGASSATSSVPSVDTYTLAQLATHNSASSCYTAINGSVFDVTPWISQHPGGAQAILSLCGVDGSGAYNAQHGGERRPANELASFKIGTLAQ